MELNNTQLQNIYQEMKKENPTLTIDEFIELIRSYNNDNLAYSDFSDYAIKILLSTQEVDEDKKNTQPIQMSH